MRPVLQSPTAWAALLTALALTLLAVTTKSAAWPERAVFVSAWWTVAFWTTGASLWLRLPPHRWRTGDPHFELARLTWLVGLGLTLLHVGLTFEVVHAWSHAAAVEHTRRTAGVGEGVFINYLFLLIWASDAVWITFGPASYTNRPRWLGWLIHAFLAFIVLNSTVVFGTGLLRWGAAVCFVLLALELFHRNRGNRVMSD